MRANRRRSSWLASRAGAGPLIGLAAGDGPDQILQVEAVGGELAGQLVEQLGMAGRVVLGAHEIDGSTRPMPKK